LDRARGEFEAAGVRLVLIGQATPRHAAHFRRRQGIELPVLADGKRRSYKAVGAKVGGVTDLFSPKVVAKGLTTLARTGQVQGRTIGNPAQLGGAIVIAPDGTLVWSHMSKDASDNASPEEILAAAGTAR
jgi:prostamide/prostaglandin F2alpha synthase